MQKLMRLPENRKGRDFVVGDLHGCYGLLMAELESVGFDESRDRLISVGDLVDRGKSSYECLNLVYEPWFHAVRGNHEEMMQEALNSGEFDLWLANGGYWAFADGDPYQVKALANDAVSRLSYAIELECGGIRFGIIHAEVPGNDWSLLEQSDTAEMTWGRSRIKRQDQTPVRGIDLVICGHTIVQQPLLLGNVLYIDTGAFNTGRLTLIDLSYLAEQVRAEA